MSDEQEKENFYRHLTAIVDETNKSFSALLVDVELKRRNITLEQFIQLNEHDIYHLCYNRYPCCACPAGTPPHVGNRILHPPQLAILLDASAGKLSKHNPRSKSASHCCSPANPNLKITDLDMSLTRVLLTNFTTVVVPGTPERNALEDLVRIRNNSFAHAREGKMSDTDFQRSMQDIERSLLVLAKVYNKEAETRQRLLEIRQQPFNLPICTQLQITLLSCLLHEKKEGDLEEQIKRLMEHVEKNTIPDCLIKDVQDVTVVEGNDAKMEVWTKEEADVEWYQQDTKLRTCEKFCITTQDNMHSLTINNTHQDDRGVYRVKIKDIERTFHLFVTDYFSRNLRNMESTEGKYATFECEVIEDNVSAKWSKSNVELTDQEKYIIERSGKTHTLTIAYTEVDDACENYSVNINKRTRMASLKVLGNSI